MFFNRKKQEPAATKATGSHANVSLSDLLAYKQIIRVTPENFRSSLERFRRQGFPVGDRGK